MSDLLAEIASLTAQLDRQRGERGMVEGRRTSTPISRRSIIDLDTIDAERDSQQALRRWAYQIVAVRSPIEIVRENWDWAVEQPWGPAMVAELESLRDRLVNGGHTVRLVLCPVCRLPVRADTFVADHRACIDVRIVESDT